MSPSDEIFVTSLSSKFILEHPMTLFTVNMRVTYDIWISKYQLAETECINWWGDSGRKIVLKLSFGSQAFHKIKLIWFYHCTIGKRTGKYSRWVQPVSLIQISISVDWENWRAEYLRIREKCRKGGYFLTWLHQFINSISFMQLPWWEKLDTCMRGIDFMRVTLS